MTVVVVVNMQTRDELYVGDRRVCQVINWPPRNTVRGWELDISCGQELLETLLCLRRHTFYVGDVEFKGLERIRRATIIDEQFKTTLVFQHCSKMDDSAIDNCSREE